jgi:hypothetical protein
MWEDVLWTHSSSAAYRRFQQMLAAALSAASCSPYSMTLRWQTLICELEALELLTAAEDAAYYYFYYHVIWQQLMMNCHRETGHDGTLLPDANSQLVQYQQCHESHSCPVTSRCPDP